MAGVSAGRGHFPMNSGDSLSGHLARVSDYSSPLIVVDKLDCSSGRYPLFDSDVGVIHYTPQTWIYDKYLSWLKLSRIRWD